MPKMLTPRDELLRTCLVPFDGAFATGEPTNNALNMDNLEAKPKLKGAVLSDMFTLIGDYNPDLLVGTPRGARWMIDIWHEWSKMFQANVILIHEVPSTKELMYLTSDKLAVEQSERIVIVDEVLNTMKASKDVYSLPLIGERAQAIVGIWDRNPSRETILPIPIEAVIKEQIPAQITDADPYWISRGDEA